MRLYDIYMKGFNDELDNCFKDTFVGVSSRAYCLGSLHAIIGDDNRSVDYLSEDEILSLVVGL